MEARVALKKSNTIHTDKCPNVACLLGGISKSVWPFITIESVGYVVSCQIALCHLSIQRIL